MCGGLYETDKPSKRIEFLQTALCRLENVFRCERQLRKVKEYPRDSEVFYRWYDDRTEELIRECYSASCR